MTVSSNPRSDRRREPMLPFVRGDKVLLPGGRIAAYLTRDALACGLAAADRELRIAIKEIEEGRFGSCRNGRDGAA